MKILLFVFLSLIVVTLVGCQRQVKESKAKLIEYPAPFYLQQTSNCAAHTFVGIETTRFKLIKQGNKICLLYDKLVDPMEQNNFAGLDEYIFIQKDLEQQLKELEVSRKFFNVYYEKCKIPIGDYCSHTTNKKNTLNGISEIIK